MTWMDYANHFQVLSRKKHFSANARSLYYAILEEFNGAFYPEEMYLMNTHLQQMSGINSTHSFDSARTALINAELITHKAQHYRLLTVKTEGKPTETEGKTDGKQAEMSIVPNSNLKIENEDKDKKEEKETPARESISQNSEEVLKTWYDCEGERLFGSKSQSLIYDENTYGKEAVVQAIKTASKTNNYEKFRKVTYNYYKKILENQQKEGENNDGGRNAEEIASESWEREIPEWVQ